MDKVKKLMKAGASLADSVRVALGDKSLAQFCLEHGVNRSNVSSGLNGGRALTEGEINALREELGGTVSEWRSLLAETAQKRALAV